MENIFDYIKWRGDLSMKSSGFNEIDGVILARLAYAPFDRIASQMKEKPTSIQEAAEALLKLPDIAESVLWKYDTDLLAELSENKRYCNMKLSGYVNQIDQETQMQFSAITIEVDDNMNYIAFRGTDDTLVGWKEDFNMCFIFPVPAQNAAVKYLEHMAPSLHGDIILGGHSKGGNLAVYSAAFCRKEIQDRIISIYNYDGPGFDEKVLMTEQYQKISKITTTFVPQSSVVGMLLEHEENYIIIKSMQKNGFLQHNIYSWLVERDHFLYLDSVTTGSRLMNYTLKGFIADMEVQQREQFIDSMYALLAQTNAHTLKELKEDRTKNAGVILSSMKNMDETTRNVLTEALRSLLRNVKSSVSQIILDEQPSLPARNSAKPTATESSP